MKPRQVVLVLGVAQTLAWASSYYLPAVLADAMARDLGVGTPWIFVAFSAGLLLSAFLGPLSGRLIDVHGGHRVLPVSNVLFALSLAGLGAAHSPAMLMGSWLLMGVAMSCGLYESAFATLARLYGAEARASITGITLIAGFASTLGWPLTAWMDGAFGWRFACYAWAAAHLFVCLPLNALLPRARRAPATSPQAAAAQGPQAGKAWIMAGLAFVFACTWFGSTAMAAHLPRVLQEAGASPTAAIAAAALVGPAQVAARVLEFWLMRRAPPIVSAQVASRTHPVGAGILLAAGAPAAPLFTVAHGAGNGVMTIANGTLPLHFFGPGGYGLRQGLLMLPARFLQAMAPFLFDVLLSRLGAAALSVTAGLGIASFLALTLLRIRGKKAA
ncbi:MAG TPA: MFS transporter [Burkholderiales bacterium]|nr:MFS transporter [Burkholderiales bacterium]